MPVGLGEYYVFADKNVGITPLAVVVLAYHYIATKARTASS
jgi:hypothetical protein